LHRLEHAIDRIRVGIRRGETAQLPHLGAFQRHRLRTLVGELGEVGGRAQCDDALLVAPADGAGGRHVLIMRQLRPARAGGWATARETGSTTSAKLVLGASTPGTVTPSPASSRYCTIIMAWLRSSSACR